MFSSLEKIFIENRIYRDIEECTTWKSVIKTIDKGLDPYKKSFYRTITEEDIVRLTQIQIKRISKFDALKADELMKGFLDELKEVQQHLDNIVNYTIDYYKRIKRKYSKGRERKTEIRDFENIEAATVAVANEKLYFDKENGFAGTSLKKDVYVCDCSDIDDIIIFRNDGSMVVKKVEPKVYIGKDVIHIAIFKRNDERTVYNMIYRDGVAGRTYVKRFLVKGITRDKEYDLTAGNEKSKVLYFTANANGEAEVITLFLHQRPRLKKLSFDFDFSELAIKGRGSKGNVVSRYTIRRIKQKEEGISTLGGQEIYLDETIMRLNREEHGKKLGSFKGDEKIISFSESGEVFFYGYDLATHFDEDAFLIEKYSEKRVYTLVYYHGAKKNYYVKRFIPEYSERGQEFVEKHPKTKITYFSKDKYPRVKLRYDNEGKRKEREDEIIDLAEFIDVKGFKAMGNRLSQHDLWEVKIMDSLPEEEEVEEEVVDESEAENSDDQMEMDF